MLSLPSWASNDTSTTLPSFAVLLQVHCLVFVHAVLVTAAVASCCCCRLLLLLKQLHTFHSLMVLSLVAMMCLVLLELRTHLILLIFSSISRLFR